MTPAFDVSVWREVSNMFNTLVDWASSIPDPNTPSNGPSATANTAFAFDKALAQEMMILAFALPNHALPVLNTETQTMLEYPDPYVARNKPGYSPEKVCCIYNIHPTPYTTHTSYTTHHTSYTIHLIPYTIHHASSPCTIHQAFSLLSSLVDEDMDRGHRHFSGFHFLFPALFPPAHSASLLEQVMDQLKKPLVASFSPSSSNPGDQQVVQAYLGSLRALHKKREAGGGHTGWSAAWESVLYAHVYNPLHAYAP
ncbi:hypothetical protein EON63_24355, partial [archaeon]